MSARLPTVFEYGSTSLVHAEKPPMNAYFPTRQNWWTPAYPPRMAKSSTSTWPPSVVPCDRIASFPMRQSCATWQYAMK